MNNDYHQIIHVYKRIIGNTELMDFYNQKGRKSKVSI